MVVQNGDEIPWDRIRKKILTLGKQIQDKKQFNFVTLSFTLYPFLKKTRDKHGGTSVSPPASLPTPRQVPQTLSMVLSHWDRPAQPGIDSRG